MIFGDGRFVKLVRSWASVLTLGLILGVCLSLQAAAQDQSQKQNQDQTPNQQKPAQEPPPAAGGPGSDLGPYVIPTKTDEAPPPPLPEARA